MRGVVDMDRRDSLISAEGEETSGRTPSDREYQTDEDVQVGVEVVRRGSVTGRGRRSG